MVCAGNLCRSPFAAAYMAKRFRQARVEAETFSRGLLALPGQHPPEEALAAASDFGVDLGDHIAQPMLAPDIERAGLILVMSPDQRTHITRARPASIGKVFLLSHVSPGELANRAIPDPVGTDVETFRAVYAEITRHVDAWMGRFGIRA